MRPNIAGVVVHLFLRLRQHDGNALVREQAVTAGALIDVSEIHIPLGSIAMQFHNATDERICITTGWIRKIVLVFVAVPAIPISVAVLVYRNQLSLFQHFDCFLERRLFDTGVPHDGIVGGPAVSLTTSTADKIRIKPEFNGSHRDCKNFVEQAEEFLCRRLIHSHSPTSVCSSIHWMNLSFGTRIRVPILMCGNPLLRTSS